MAPARFARHYTPHNMARADHMDQFEGTLPFPVDVMGPLATLGDLATADIYASEPIEIVVEPRSGYGGVPSVQALVLVCGIEVATITQYSFEHMPCPFAVADYGTGCDFEHIWGASPLTETLPGCVAYMVQDLDANGATPRRIGGLYLPALLKHAAEQWGWRSRKHPALLHLRGVI